MSGYLAPLISGQLFDDDGDPLNGGLVYTYVGGSVNTPLDTYTTYALNVANQNPIHASASGRVIAYIPAGTDYKFVVKTSAGVSVWTQDHVSVPDPVADGLEIGMMQFWTVAAVPTGWLWANGQAVSRGTYADLFALIGTTYGIGDGVTTFNVPNMTDRLPIGVGTLSLAGTAGAYNHTHTGPSHTHTGPSHTHTGPAHTHSVPALTIAAKDLAIGATSSAVMGRDGAGNLNWRSGLDSSWKEIAPGGAGTPTEYFGITSSSTGTGTTGSDGTGATGASGTGNTGASGTGDTGTANPPMLAAYWIIRAV